MITSLIALAIAIVLGLASYAAWLYYRLWQLKKRQQSAAAQVGNFDPQARTAKQLELRKTLYILADALLDEKMTHTEGCLRICAMANNLVEIDSFRQEYGVLFRVAEATAHFPILDEWQALSKEEKQRVTRERKEIEGKYREAVIEAVQRVRGNYR